MKKIEEKQKVNRVVIYEECLKDGAPKEEIEKFSKFLNDIANSNYPIEIEYRECSNATKTVEVERFKKELKMIRFKQKINDFMNGKTKKSADNKEEPFEIIFASDELVASSKTFNIVGNSIFVVGNSVSALNTAIFEEMRHRIMKQKDELEQIKRTNKTRNRT